MLYKLETKYNDTYKREKAALFFELRKVKDNLSYVKTKEEKKVLTQHIKALRKQLKRYDVGNITYTLKRGKMSIVNKIQSYNTLHSQLTATKKYITEKIKIDRQIQKTPKFRMKEIRGIKRQMLGGVCLVPATISKAYLQKKIMEIKAEKRPKTQENHIGIEIEFASVLSDQQIGRLFFEEGLTQYVQLMEEYTDGKDEKHERGHEIAIVAPETEILCILEKVCMVLNEKIDANITFGCGFHVHIDCRNRDHNKVFQNFFNTQEILYSMVSYVRRTNRHVKMLPEKILYPDVQGNNEYYCRNCWTEDQYDNGEVEPCDCDTPKEVRWFGINGWAYKHHKTIEVRIHSGTTNINKIRNWLKLLLAIADNASIKKPVTDTEQFFKNVNLTEDLKKYVHRRIETFKQKQ